MMNIAKALFRLAEVRQPMPLAAGIVVIAILASSCATSASNAPQAAAGSSPNAHSGHEAAASMTPRVPAYRTKPIDRRSLPVTLDPAKFTTPYIAHSYRVAKEIPEVLAEQPCYCYCDAGFGHGSLLDCHIDDHSAGCAVCLKESLLAEELHRQGKSADDIREAIKRGDWQSVLLK